MVASKLAAYGAAIVFIAGTALSLCSGTTTAAASASAASDSPVAAAASPVEKTRRTLDHGGFRENGALYLPLKDLAPLLDLQILWNAEKSSVEVTGLYQALTLKIGQPKAYTSGNKMIMLDAPTVIRDGVTYVSSQLFSKAFNLPIGWEGKGQVSVLYTERYIKSISGREMFWLHKEKGVVYSGSSGKLPSRAGTAGVQNLDWASLSSRTINSSSFVLDIDNAHGEPHINVSRYRILLHDGHLVRQAQSHYGGVRNLGMKKNVFAFQGNLVMVDQNILSLVNPDGHVFKTYDLTALTGIEDAFAVEAVETDFLLVRPYQKGTLFLIDRQSGGSTALYSQLLGTEDLAWLEQYPVSDVDYPGDRLQYTGRSGNTLSFEWRSFADNRQIHFSYALPPFP